MEKNKISRIFEFIQKKNYKEAEKLLNDLKDSFEKFNLLGIINFNQNNLEKAEKYFEKALQLNYENPDVLFNYAYLNLKKNKPFEAWRYLMRIRKKDWAVYDLLGDIEISNRSKSFGLMYYFNASKLTNNILMKEKYEKAKKQFFKNIKIVFLTLPGLETFIRPIAKVISFLYDTKLIISNNQQDIANAINWADIVWLEWGNQMAEFVTNNFDLKSKIVLCRIHGYEVFTDIPSKIDWSKIDHVFFVANHKRELFYKRFGNLVDRNKTSILRNGINLNEFPFFDKSKNHGKNLAIIGNINYRKGFEILLLAYSELLKEDNEYRLFVRGDFQDPRYQFAIETMIEELNLKDKVKFIPRVENLSEWLKTMDFILSTSIEESFHYTVGEAMAVGLKPVIHAWKESREIWPSKFVFKSLEEFKKIILEQDYNSQEYRSYIEDHYPMEKQLHQIEEILEKFEKSISVRNITLLDIVDIRSDILRFSFRKTLNKKYIWYVMSDFANFQYGGGERVIVSFSKEAKKYGYDLIFISNNYSKKALDIMKDLGFEGEIVIIKTPLTTYPKNEYQLNQLKEEIEKIRKIYPPDLVISHPVVTSIWMSKINSEFKFNLKHYLTTIVNFFIGDEKANKKFYVENLKDILFINVVSRKYLETFLNIKNIQFKNYRYVGVPFFSKKRLENIKLNNNFDDKIRIITYPRFVYTKTFVLNAIEDLAKLLKKGYEFYVNVVGVGGFSEGIRKIIEFYDVGKYIKLIPLKKIDFRFVAIHDLAINIGISANETSYLGIPTIFAFTTLWFSFLKYYTGYMNPCGILGIDFKLESSNVDFYNYNTFYEIVKRILDQKNPKEYLRELGKKVKSYMKQSMKSYEESVVFKNILRESKLI